MTSQKANILAEMFSKNSSISESDQPLPFTPRPALCTMLELHIRTRDVKRVLASLGIKKIGPYQCGFRHGKFTIDLIFTLHRILGKRHENQNRTHYLFVDFRAAFDSPVRDRVYTAMSELGIPAKLIRICRMTLSNS